jgi:hypothetical protein
VVDAYERLEGDVEGLAELAEMAGAEDADEIAE